MKGSIPARTDTVAEDYPPYQQAAIASLQLDTVVPSLAHGVAASPAWTKAITTAVVKFGGDGHPDALANALIDAAHDALGRVAATPHPPPAWHPGGGLPSGDHVTETSGTAVVGGTAALSCGGTHALQNHSRDRGAWPPSPSCSSAAPA